MKLIIGLLFAVGVVALAMAELIRNLTDQIAKSLMSLSSLEFHPSWMLPALFIAGFATGYGVRSLVSYSRRRRARRLRYGSRLPTSHRLQPADNSHISIVPRDSVGDLPIAAVPKNRSAT